jgi:hypothetical protein
VRFQLEPPEPPGVMDALQEMLAQAGVPRSDHSRLQQLGLCLLHELGASPFVQTLRSGRAPLPPSYSTRCDLH